MAATAIKWHGGKSYLASRIIGLMPTRAVNSNNPSLDDSGWLHYVEPYAGGLAVLLANDPDGISEVANDLNRELTNFWRVLQSDIDFSMFRRLCEATPFSEIAFGEAWLFPVPRSSVIESQECYRAWQFFIQCRQSLAGRMDSFAPLTRNRTRRGMNEQASAWLSAVDGLTAVHERLKRVVILNRPAIDVIKQQDGPRTLFYVDPPYVHGTRVTTGEYVHEMTNLDHQDLLDTLSQINGRFLLSGYSCPLYDAAAEAHGWRHVDIDIANHASGAKQKQRKTERVWMNYSSVSES